VDDGRWIRVLTAMGIDRGRLRPKSCTASALLLGVSGAAVSVASDDDATRMTVCYSNDVARSIEDLQFSLGEGPSVDALVMDHPVLEPDLSRAPLARWPGFGPAALALGASAVFGFPLRSVGTRVGTMNLYCDKPGELSGEQFADALLVAELLASQVVGFHGRTSGGIPLADESGLTLVVHQATGMIAAQLDVSVHEALLRLRARAFAKELPIATVAKAVVDRSLRFDDELR
jgi:hypothetical protein